MTQLRFHQELADISRRRAFAHQGKPFARIAGTRRAFRMIGLVLLCLSTAGCLEQLGVSLAKRTISYAALNHPNQGGICGDLYGQELVACQAALAYEHPEVAQANKEFAAYLDSESLEEGWPDLCAAAGRGHPAAQLIMARAYRSGWKPAERSDAKAYQWYIRAEAGGHPVANLELKQLVELMPPAMVEVQRQRAYTWEPDPEDCPPRAVAAGAPPAPEAESTAE